MRDSLIAATDAALLAVTEDRFLQTERGYQGRFYCALQVELDRYGLLKEPTILEMEYQKSARRHRIRQRPDIILHIPAEITGSVTVGNLAVWALKRRASAKDAADDYEKLEEMHRSLNYPWGCFVNIDSTEANPIAYSDVLPSGFSSVAVAKVGSRVNTHWAKSGLS